MDKYRSTNEIIDISKNELISKTPINSYEIKDEICSIFSIENLLETIRSLGSLHSLRTEFYDQVIENKMIISNYPKMKEFNDCESKSKIEMVKFSELMNDK